MIWKDSKWILNGLRQFEAVKIMRIYKIGENVFQVIDVMVRETGSRWLHAAVAAVSTLSACWTCVDKPSTAALAVKSIQPDCTTKHEAVFYHCHFQVHILFVSLFFRVLNILFSFVSLHILGFPAVHEAKSARQRSSHQFHRCSPMSTVGSSAVINGHHFQSACAGIVDIALVPQWIPCETPVICKKKRAMKIKFHFPALKSKNPEKWCHMALKQWISVVSLLFSAQKSFLICSIFIWRFPKISKMGDPPNHPFEDFPCHGNPQKPSSDKGVPPLEPPRNSFTLLLCSPHQATASCFWSSSAAFLALESSMLFWEGFRASFKHFDTLKIHFHEHSSTWNLESASIYILPSGYLT